MRARLALLGALLAAAACSGVLFNNGNDFPCDFSQPAGLRDAVCAPGDVCGVTNRCQRYVYEGPRFEGTPTLPDFSSDAGSGVLLHPRVLSAPVTKVSQDPSPLGPTYLLAGGESFALRLRGAVDDLGDAGAGLNLVIPLSAAVRAAGLVDAGLPGDFFLSTSALDEAAVTYLDGAAATSVTIFDPSLPGPARALRSQRLRATGYQATVLDATGRSRVVPRLRLTAISRAGRAGEVQLDFTGAVPRLAFSPWAIPDGGAPFDVAWASRPGLDTPVIVTADAIYFATDAGLAAANSEALTAATAATVKSDARHNVFALLLEPPGSTGRTTLSTWLLVRNGADYQFDRAWPDCTPCVGVGERPATFVPVFTSAGVTVEVGCQGAAAPRLVRVLGSVATEPREACDVEDVDLPMDWRSLSVVNRSLVHDFAAQDGVALGGQHGELWAGDTLEHAQPAYLERVPMDVAAVPSRAGSLLLALTDRYVAQLDKPNGFRRLLISSDGPQRPLALVHQSNSWMVTAAGDLRTVSVDDAGADLVAFGPRLLDGRDQPVQRPLVGEAVTQLDGGLVSAVIAADDSLYLVPFDFEPTSSPAELAPATPVLTPAPSSLIRSLALERTPIGTDGVTKVRGYLVTARTVYLFQLGGTPARWSAVPLALSGGEPLEVWFDNPRGGLARAGYRDGQVYTLPGGFLLADSLPGTDGGFVPQVLDYENLAGWPVAYATTGVYVAAWGQRADGSLDNRFPDGGVNKPMAWREVALPDGGRPWLDGAGAARDGRLFVKTEAQVTRSDGTYSQTFRLLLFLPDQVLELGRHVRHNTSTVSQ